MDSFIIYAAQQMATNSVTEDTHELPLSYFSPSNIRLAPFPTREYTDDEFQSIIKTVMGVLYVSSRSFVLFVLETNNNTLLEFYPCY